MASSGERSIHEKQSMHQTNGLSQKWGLDRRMIWNHPYLLKWCFIHWNRAAISLKWRVECIFQPGVFTGHSHTEVPCLPSEEWQHSACTACFSLTGIFNFQCLTGQQEKAQSHVTCISFIIIFNSKQRILACVSFVRDHRIHVFYPFIMRFCSFCKLTMAFSLRSLFSVIVTYGNANLVVSAANFFWYCMFPVQTWGLLANLVSCTWSWCVEDTLTFLVLGY